MRKLLLLLAALTIPGALWAPVSEQLNIEETDGSPSTFPYKLKVSPGSLTDNGDGTATLSTSAGGGGGASTLEVFVGAARSSPTPSISGYTGDFRGTIVGSTFYFVLNPNTTNYIHNKSTLQTGTTAFPDYLYVGSTASISGSAFMGGTLNVGEIQDRGCASNTGVIFQNTSSLLDCSTNLTWDGNALMSKDTGGAAKNFVLDEAAGSSLNTIGFSYAGANAGEFGMFNDGADFKMRFGSVDEFNLNTNGLLRVSSFTARGTALFNSSVTVTAADGVYATYGISGGSLTARNLPSGECVQTTTNGELTTTGSACGSGGGGSSSLAVTTGTASTYANPAISSPTSVLVFHQSQFTETANGTTAYMQINFSSITAIGIPQVAGNITLNGSTFGVPITDISTGTNLAVSGMINLNGDTIGVSTIDISTGTNLTASGNAVLSGDNVGVPRIVIGSGTVGNFDVSSTSASATGSDGLYARYGASLGSATIRNITGTTQCLQADTNGLISGSGAACGSGSVGGSSTLAVTTGTVSGWVDTVPASSPTAVINFDKLSFNASLQGGATAFIESKAYINFKPEDAQFLTSNFPQIIISTFTNIPLSSLGYDASVSTELAHWKFYVPNYRTGTPTLSIYWYAATASSGDVWWSASVACVTPNTDTTGLLDPNGKAFDSYNTFTDSHLGTTNKRLHQADITMSSIDSMEAGDLCWIRIGRSGANSADTMTGDANLLYAVLSF